MVSRREFSFEGKEIEVDFAEDMGEVTAQELRVLGVPVALTEELLWRLNDIPEDMG